MGAPRLIWDPGLLADARPLDDVGPVGDGPLPTLAAAFAAISDDRAGSKDRTHLVTRLASGWRACAYRERRIGAVDLDELSFRDIPLGGDPAEPRTYVIDAAGRVGRIVREGSGYGLKDTGRHVGDPVEEPPPPPDGHVPAVAPAPMANHGGNVAWSPRYAFRPGPGRAELQATLRWIAAHAEPEAPVRAVGSLHSWSPAAATDGAVIHPEGMAGIEIAGPGLVRVGAGTTIRQLNETLWNEHDLALPALGGFDGQTLGGVLPTGTHGSVLSRGPLADGIRGIDLVLADGTAIELDPDHEAFHACTVSLGATGVAHSYLIEVGDAFHMNEVRTLTDVDDLVDSLRGGEIARRFTTGGVPDGQAAVDDEHPAPAYHLEFLVNPHGRRALITSRHPVPPIDDEAGRFPPRPSRNLIEMFQIDDRYDRPDIQTWISENVPAALAAVTQRLSSIYPPVTPRLVDAAIASMDDAGHTQRSYNVFNIGDGANSIPALSGTIFVPLREDRYLRALQIIRTTADRFARERGRYHTGPIALRFVAGSPALLAPSEDVCSFEFIFAGDTPWAEEMIAAYDAALLKELGPEVWPHWGQLAPQLTPERVRASYPEYPRWRELRDALDPRGRFLTLWLRSVLG